MPKQVKIAYDNMGKGDLVEVTGLGLFPNGYTSKIEDWQFDSWVAANPDAVKQYVEGDLISFPSDPVEVERTGAQLTGELEREIIERQNARTLEEAAKEERASVMQNLRGERDKATLVDGRVVDLKASESKKPTSKVDQADKEGGK